MAELLSFWIYGQNWNRMGTVTVMVDRMYNLEAVMVEYVEEFVEHLRWKGAAENTVTSYQRDLRAFFEYCLGQGVEEEDSISESFVRDYIRFLELENKKPATISRMLASLRVYYHYLLSAGHRTNDPTERVKTPHIERTLPHILTPEEVASLLCQPEGDAPKALRDRAMLELLYATGIRVSELLALKVGDVNLNMEYVVCQQKRGRVVPFGKTAKNALQRYLEKARPMLVKNKECEWLFTNMRGEQMTRQGFWKLIRTYGKAAGIEGEITPHTLRHSFAAHLVNNGADLYAVQEMMGYSDLSGTQMYASLRPASIREAYTKAHPRE